MRPDTAGEETSRLLWFIGAVGVWSVNPYRKCPFRCVYCIAASQGEAVPWYAADRVVPELREALEQVPPDKELFVGALVDAYPPVEERLGLTRAILEEFSRQKRPFCINTKSTLVCREIDILQSHPAHCDVYLGLCSLDEGALRVLEPGAPSVTERLAAIRALKTAGVDVNVDAGPWIPGVSNAEDLISRLPPGVGLQFEPLDIRHFGDSATVLGRTYTQQGINAAYQAERRRIGDMPGVRWKAPLTSR